MMRFNIQPVSKALEGALRQKIDRKTKPLGALGRLEELALKIGLIQNSLIPELTDPHIVVFAGDHGITAEGVSAYPQEVTAQMVLNFLKGGAAINVFCRQNGIVMQIVDAGVNYDFRGDPHLIDAKIARGTKNFLRQPAMSMEECQQAMERGAEIVSSINRQGCNIIGFGEMGIGNTSSASMLMSQICSLPLADCVGRGAGLNDQQLNDKIKVCTQAMTRHNGTFSNPTELLAALGGFEIAMMCGAMLQAAEHKMLILADGFISSAAFLVAHAMDASILDYAFFCHQSDEAGHKKILEYLEVRPILALDMRLGEGTGVALAYPLLQSSVLFLNEMASFESAEVSEKVPEKHEQRT